MSDMQSERASLLERRAQEQVTIDSLRREREQCQKDRDQVIARAQQVFETKQNYIRQAIRDANQQLIQIDKELQDLGLSESLNSDAYTDGESDKGSLSRTSSEEEEEQQPVRQARRRDVPPGFEDRAAPAKVGPDNLPVLNMDIHETRGRSSERRECEPARAKMILSKRLASENAGNASGDTAPRPASSNGDRGSERSRTPPPRDGLLAGRAAHGKAVKASPSKRPSREIYVPGARRRPQEVQAGPSPTPSPESGRSEHQNGQLNKPHNPNPISGRDAHGDLREAPGSRIRSEVNMTSGRRSVLDRLSDGRAEPSEPHPPPSRNPEDQGEFHPYSGANGAQVESGSNYAQRRGTSMGHYVDGNNLMLPNGGRMKREDRHERGSAGPEPMASRAANAGGRVDILEGEMQTSRRQLNANMDHMIPHDGSLLSMAHHQNFGNSGGTQSGEDIEDPAAAFRSTEPKKAREWDSAKSKDPQQDMNSLEISPWGQIQRLGMSNWADDSPRSPADVMSRSQSGSGRLDERRRDAFGGAPSRFSGQRNFEDDFPGLRTGPSPSAPAQPSWTDEESRLQSFPTLGNALAPVHTGVWGANPSHIKERLNGNDAAAIPKSLIPAMQAQAQGPTQNVEEFERSTGLRHPDDRSPDMDHLQQVRSKKDFVFMEMVRKGGPAQLTNTLEGLELHKSVLSDAEQLRMEQRIQEWVHLGLQNRLRGRTFSAPKKWARGKGRITVQFGCCYNYAKDSYDRKPGIIPEEVVEPMPPVLVALAQRLVRWGIIPKAMEPDSAIVNIYEVDDCIPPHIDHHDFSRPFCTISLLSEEEIMFGQRLVPEQAGVFHGVNDQHHLIRLPTGSCLILNGNGADVAMHCVPPVKQRRMSITLRKMGMKHADRVKAEAAKVASGLYRTVQTNGRAPDIGGRLGGGQEASTWRTNNQASENLMPLRTQHSLADFVVTRKSRGQAEADSRPSEGRWEQNDSQ